MIHETASWDRKTRVAHSILRLIYKLQRKRVIHFLHIGKTGGTAIKYALKSFPTSSDNVIYIHSHKFSLLSVPKGEKCFFFLRDPIQRYISGFYSRLRQGKPRYFYPWSEAERVAFEEFKTPDQLAIALSSKDDEEQQRARNAMNSIKHVNHHYSKWLISMDYFDERLPDIFFVGFQETLGNDFEDLKIKLGLPSEAVLPTDEVNSHKTPENLDKSISTDAENNLREWYKEDYLFLDHCKQHMIKGLP